MKMSERLEIIRREVQEKGQIRVSDLSVQSVGRLRQQQEMQ